VVVKNARDLDIVLRDGDLAIVEDFDKCEKGRDKGDLVVVFMLELQRVRAGLGGGVLNSQGRGT
jgi:hypothetical protein